MHGDIKDIDSKYNYDYKRIIFKQIYNKFKACICCKKNTNTNLNVVQTPDILNPLNDMSAMKQENGFYNNNVINHVDMLPQLHQLNLESLADEDDSDSEELVNSDISETIHKDKQTSRRCLLYSLCNNCIKIKNELCHFRIRFFMSILFSIFGFVMIYFLYSNSDNENRDNNKISTGLNIASAIIHFIAIFVPFKYFISDYYNHYVKNDLAKLECVSDLILELKKRNVTALLDIRRHGNFFQVGFF